MVEATRRHRKAQAEVGAMDSAVYSSKIIKAGALLADTKTLLAQWDLSVPAQINLDRLRRDNVFGKASRSRVKDVLAMFRQRFLGEVLFFVSLHRKHLNDVLSTKRNC
jgi:Putative inner membrane protein (DUF1819)